MTKKQNDTSHSLKIKQKNNHLKEMATVGTMDDFTILVYTDHDPSHFHLLKNGEFEAKINIETLEVFDYKFQKNGKTVSGSYLRKLKRWLEKKSLRNSKITNKEAIQFSWQILNS